VFDTAKTVERIYQVHHELSMETSAQNRVLPPWMVLLMEFLETLSLNPRIDLCGRNVGVPEQRLDDPEVCSAL